MGNDIPYTEIQGDVEARFNHLPRARSSSESDLEDDEDFGNWALGTDYFSICSYMPN